jgi:excinuclease UvrABC helicase subunit UvrB
MKTKIVVILAMLGVAMPGAFAKDATGSLLKKMFMSRIEAFSKNDTAEMRKLCTKNYQLINSTGTKMNIEEVKQYNKNQKEQIKSYVVLTFQPYIAQDESMAFAISEIEEEITHDTTAIKNNLIMTEIYRKVNNKWKIQLTQISQKICGYPYP